MVNCCHWPVAGGAGSSRVGKGIGSCVWIVGSGSLTGAGGTISSSSIGGGRWSIAGGGRLLGSEVGKSISGGGRSLGNLGRCGVVVGW